MFENAKKQLSRHTATLLTIYHRIDSELQSYSFVINVSATRFVLTFDRNTELTQTVAMIIA